MRDNKERRLIIDLKGIKKRFFEGTENEIGVLKGIDLQVYEGEFVSIVGASGSGKSTLMNIIGVLDRASEGSYLLDGADINQADDNELSHIRNKKIGFVFQTYNLIPRISALKNVERPMLYAKVPGAECTERAKELLKLVGMEDRMKHNPDELSGGQKQRVAIARALAPSPKVLLCDEATSALDPTTTRSILSLLKEINRTLGITIVVITHEMSVIEEICDRVAIIDHSQIAEVGEVSDIFMNPKTEIAKRLLYASGRLGEEVLGERCLRIIFDGTQTSSPVICDMVLECGAPVNILFADTKTIEGKMHGYTLIQLPENRELGDKMKKYLDLHGVQYLEEAYHV